MPENSKLKEIAFCFRKMPHQSTNEMTTTTTSIPKPPVKAGEGEKLSTWFPLSFTMKIKNDGDISITNERMVNNWRTTDVATKLEFMNVDDTSEVEVTEEALNDGRS